MRIEGDWKQQEKLKNDPWTAEKIWKKSLKHGIFFFVSFLIANTFLSYVIGYEELWAIVLDNPLNHIGGLIAILVFTTIFYLVFSKMREQVCTVVCPYGRLQGVLLDNRSLTVAYDYERGEGRAKVRKGEDRAAAGKGDCIDCAQCIHVCPTGIDIRNGTQLECVNCTACMDACDFMMDKVGLEKGLIRYASIDGIEKKHKFQWTARVIGYCVVFVGLLVVMTGMIAGRSDFEATVLRTRGTLFQKLEQGQYSNIYDITMVNKTNEEFPVELKVLDGGGEIQMIGDAMVLQPQKEAKSKFMILLDEDQLTGRKIDLIIGVYSNGELIQEAKTTFIAPML